MSRPARPSGFWDDLDELDRATEVMRDPVLQRMRLCVVAVAVRLPSGMVCTLPPPARHHHVVRQLCDEGHPQQEGDEQGFLLSNGTFLGRKEAGLLAESNGQIQAMKWPPNLYSEDLW